MDLLGVDRRAVVLAGDLPVEDRFAAVFREEDLFLELEVEVEGRLALRMRARKPRCSRLIASSCFFASFCMASRARSSALNCRSNSFSMRTADVSS